VIAASVVAKWEGGLDPREDPDVVAATAPSGHGPAVAVESFDAVRPGQVAGQAQGQHQSS
jgi:hypothetical protein